MSSARFASVVKSAKLRENNHVWFPRWLDAYRRFCDVGRNDAVRIHRELLVAFLRQEKARGRKAWQRLQIVRAVEHYRNAILGTAAPDLGDIRDTLAQVAERDVDRPTTLTSSESLTRTNRNRFRLCDVNYANRLVAECQILSFANHAFHCMRIRRANQAASRFYSRAIGPRVSRPRFFRKCHFADPFHNERLHYVGHDTSPFFSTHKGALKRFIFCHLPVSS